MNWTGGRLSRHLGISNPVKDRQKQHFAKVQQALRSGPKKHSPIKWSFFDHFVEGRERGQRESSAAQHGSSQGNGRGENQPIVQNHGHLSSGKSLVQQHRTQHLSGSRELSHSRQHLVPIKQPSGVLENDLYNATPPHWEVKRKKEDSISESEMENLAEQEVEEASMSEKRRKILRKGDWVGVSIQRPLQIAFASPKKEEDIGRRRVLADGQRARYSSKQKHIASPFLPKSRPLVNQRSSQEEPHRRESAKMDVMISIGGRVVPPGVSSSSAPRRIRSHPTIARRRSQTISSDVMLLDAEASITQVSPRIATSNLAASRYSASVVQVLSQSPKIGRINTSLADEVEQDNQISYEAEDISNGWAERFSETVPEPHDNVHGSVSDRDFSEVFPDRNNSRISTASYSNIQSGRPIVSSSTTSIHHPAPRRSRVSVLLRSASSEIVESTLAQVGKVKPLVPRSQILDNEIWETWISPEQQSDEPFDNAYFKEHRNAQRLYISPGISTASAIWYADTRRSGSEDKWSSELRGLNPEAAAPSSNKSNMPVSGPSKIAPRNSGTPQQKTEVVEEELGVYQADQGSTKAPISTVPPNKEIIEEDQRVSWTKFLFGGTSDEFDVPSPTPRRDIMPARRGQYFGTSILGQTSRAGSALSDPNSALQGTNTPAAPFPISGGVSRITEASPCPSGWRYREQTMEMAFRVDSPPWKGGISVQAERGSFLASSPESVSASVAVPAISNFSASDLVETASPYRPDRKVTFKKPKSFVGRKATPKSLSYREPLHIGRHLGKSDDGIGSRKKKERDMYSSIGSDEQDEQEDVESIEDD